MSYTVQTVIHTVTRLSAGPTPPNLLALIMPGLPAAAVAIYAVKVAADQARASRDKLRLDAFERRLALYKALRKELQAYSDKVLNGVRPQYRWPICLKRQNLFSAPSSGKPF
jgi:hypothetical protein